MWFVDDGRKAAEEAAAWLWVVCLDIVREKNGGSEKDEERKRWKA